MGDVMGVGIPAWVWRGLVGTSGGEEKTGLLITETFLRLEGGDPSASRVTVDLSGVLGDKREEELSCGNMNGGTNRLVTSVRGG